MSNTNTPPLNSGLTATSACCSFVSVRLKEDNGVMFVFYARSFIDDKAADLSSPLLHADEPMGRTCDGYSGANGFAHCHSFFGR